MNDPWKDLADWWLTEVASDPAYETDVAPLLVSLLPDIAGRRVLELGCGEGRIMGLLRSRGAQVFGCDLNEELASRAATGSPTVVGRLPDLGYLRSERFDALVAVLVIEHIEPLGQLFAEAARMARAGGHLVAVMNHPLYTAPRSAPIVDPDDSELWWRWGSYLSPGTTDEPAGRQSITFHHRPMAELLNHAARSGWLLEEMAERPISPAAFQAPALEHQTELPRLLGVRWRKG